MNSFNTDEDTKKLLRKYGNIKVEVHSFCQSRYPRINRETFMPIARSLNDNDLEWQVFVWRQFKFLREISFSWYPPGHGNFYDSFYNSGLVEKFIEAGKKVNFVEFKRIF